MPKDQRTFTKEFKLEAVRLVQSSGKSITQIARDLGIARRAPCTIGANYRRSRASKHFLAVGIKRRRREELRRLKRELETVRQERDILKRAMP